jgi:signal transduction histidine kinase
VNTVCVVTRGAHHRGLRDDTTVTVEVRDDGVGFDPTASTGKPCDRGLGLPAGR